MVQLLERTLIRVGNEEYARANHSYGLSTLRNAHVRISGAKMYFHFRGKSGVTRDLELADPQLARVVRRCRALPGALLFQCVDAEGMRHRITPADVNAYLRAIADGEFTAKSFRTWGGSTAALRELADRPPPESEGAAKRGKAEAIRRVADHLGNTPAVCRGYYIHPAVLAAYSSGELARLPRASQRRGIACGLTPDERALLALLQRHDTKRPLRRRAA